MGLGRPGPWRVDKAKGWGRAGQSIEVKGLGLWAQGQLDLASSR